MKYEIYIDSLWILNFGMNLYLLELTNCVLHRTAVWKRIVIGALTGSTLSVMPLLFPLPVFFSAGIGFLLSSLSMVLITFRISSIHSYFRLTEVLLVLSMLLGAVMQYMFRRIIKNSGLPMSLFWLISSACFLLIRRQFGGKRKASECKVTLSNERTKIKINALIDTGNSLIEPISGLPVAVLDRNVFENLFRMGNPKGFRVIPYHSIDKKSGIIPGYLIPEMQIERDGFCRNFYNVYVGVRPQEMEMSENYKMIINPQMLKERKVG